MPKKPLRNAFYFYMQDFKAEQQQKGVNYNNMAAVVDAAGPSWKDAPPSVRSKYEGMARKHKQKLNISDQKFTSTGIPMAVIEKNEREAEEAEETERQDIKNLVKLRAFNNTAKSLDIYVIDVNFYCKTGTDYIIGESTVLRFNVEDGIKDTYHEIINPGVIPLGYAYDMKLGCKEFGLEMPDEISNKSNYMQILANIIDYLKQQDRTAQTLPPIFTIPDKVAPVKSFLQQLCKCAAEDENMFRIYKLDALFFTLINALKSQGNEGFPKESLALLQLKKDPFKYSPGIGCEHHEETDKSVECTLSRVKRWSYTVLDACCPVAGVAARPSCHVPPDYDLERIQIYQEQKRGRAAPSIAGFELTMSSCDSSVVDGSYIDSSMSMSTENTRREKKVHVPLRMPKADYSQAIRLAPDLTEDEFPTLGSHHMGRGRGMGGSFSRGNNK